MWKLRTRFSTAAMICALGVASSIAAPPPSPAMNRTTRSDGAERIDFSLSGSLQNPAWSPDADYLLLTVFQNGYNLEPADLLVGDLADFSVRTLVADGSGNVSLPGSTWNSVTERIVFSSSREPHDEIYSIDDFGVSGDESQITSRLDRVAYEPSFSPDGLVVVFESHAVDSEDNGVITAYEVDGSGAYEALTSALEDCRQPNWSPTGETIVYQKLEGGRWDLWLTDPAGLVHVQLTAGPGDSTDASFSPDGRFLVYSNDAQSDLADLFILSIEGGTPRQVTSDSGYDGAPSWSPDGLWIAFESSSGDPDGSAGTVLWRIRTSVVFADGFESADLSRWSRVMP